ncbi:ABC-type branched-chain amino acid transport system, ATPase component [Ferrithrix thermotolerans DSM 19514]|jgi:ABC-type transport system involved in cytochrome c biogenesis ATPase subunit|uniref:ABC-type branched-chain amino acid transport system, ATPase component n=1 Tax=Ferrithrix thermotolerans DSM 19514 TaxID=1121881 RepID=A0A1M4VFX9_9ACTN|nr:hypothetical protein [Ferrithrix thermotolerans]SHE67705.1 ABC-type branched-chain amino acid transport system, ATPase component [Ferrithrix thermotolerans DSM 19514]
MASKERPKRVKRQGELNDVVLQLSNLESFHGGFAPLSATFSKGDSVRIVAPKISMATSLLTVLAGVVPPLRGKAVVLGARCNSVEGRSVISSFGVTRGPDWGLTLLDSLLLYQGFVTDPLERRRRALDVIEELDIGTLTHSRLHELDPRDRLLFEFACFRVQPAQISVVFGLHDPNEPSAKQRIFDVMADLRSKGRVLIWLEPPSYLLGLIDVDIQLQSSPF